jgi:hypothetical protein
MSFTFLADQEIASIASAYSLDALEIAVESFVALDFSDDSIQNVERLLAGLHNNLPRDQPSEETIWIFAKAFGSYIGEVLCRNYQGEWGIVHLGDESFPGVSFGHDNNSMCWPWARAHKRLTNGPEENVWHYFQSITRQYASPKKPWFQFW